jgi:hypothetical protein
VVVAYLGAGYLAYQGLSVVTPRCGDKPFAGATPADFAFTAEAGAAAPDTTDYRLPTPTR